jgi:hypothetical protein
MIASILNKGNIVTRMDSSTEVKAKVESPLSNVGAICAVWQASPLLYELMGRREPRPEATSLTLGGQSLLQPPPFACCKP